MKILRKIFGKKAAVDSHLSLMKACENKALIEKDQEIILQQKL